LAVSIEVVGIVMPPLQGLIKRISIQTMDKNPSFGNTALSGLWSNEEDNDSSTESAELTNSGTIPAVRHKQLNSSPEGTEIPNHKLLSKKQLNLNRSS
jgi:hypothetical protein